MSDAADSDQMAAEQAYPDGAFPSIETTNYRAAFIRGRRSLRSATDPALEDRCGLCAMDADHETWGHGFTVSRESIDRAPADLHATRATERATAYKRS